MAYQRARTKERREHVQLTMDMYILTFGLYGGMAMVALLVFLGEVLIGRKQPKTRGGTNQSSARLKLGSVLNKTKAR